MLSPVRIMQYFKNSICIKELTPVHNFLPPANWAPQLNVKHMATAEKKPNHIDQFYKFFIQPPQICVRDENETRE